jgi:1,4-alpha-glucan branching enzyme
MSSIALSAQAHNIRAWTLGGENPKVVALFSFERRIYDVLSHQMIAERGHLVRSLAEERYRNIALRILRPDVPCFKVKELEEKISKIITFSDGLQRDDYKEVRSKEAFDLLPDDVKELLCWAVWLHFDAPDKSNVGRERIFQNIFLLKEIRSPLLFMGEGALCEQVLHYYEHLLAIEKQENTLYQLKELEQKLRSAFANLEEILGCITSLPKELQWRIHGDVYSFSVGSKEGEEWGKSQLLKNPKLLITLRDPHKERCLLDHYIQEEQESLEKLRKVNQVDEFERIYTLFPYMSSSQRQALLCRVSKEVKAFALELEEEIKRRELLEKDQRHLYQWRGAHPKREGTFFQVYAPNARQVQLVLTAYGKEEHVIAMNRNFMGLWEIFTPHAQSGRTYRFCICDSLGNWGYRTDPFGLAVVETEGVAESVVPKIDPYLWDDRAWMKERAKSNPLKRPLSIYEISADYWKRRGGDPLSFRELAHEIVAYQKTLNFTHVEIYGVLDNKHDYSWGYQPDHFLAVNRRMARHEDAEDGLKFLVDLCHRNGIGVIIDWVPAHYKHDHAGDLSQSLHNYDGTDLFASENSPWGTVYFDFGKEETRRLLLASALYWLKEAHVDGLRLDAVGPMIRRNGEVKQPAVDFLKELNDVVHNQFPGVLMIAEETDGFPSVTRPTREGGLGFDAKIGVHIPYQMRQYFKTPYEYRGEWAHHYGELLSNFREVGGHERWMLSHSHDDAASGTSHGHSTLHSSMPTQDPWRRFADIRLFHALNLLSPGAGHMIHMGDELGQIWSWNGRLQAWEGAVEWHLLEEGNADSRLHRNLLEYVGDLNRLYRSKPAFWKHGDWGYKPISDNALNKVIGYHRLDYEGGRLAIFYNFSPIGYSCYDFPLSSLKEDPDLEWICGAREIFNSDGVQYGGTGKFGNTSAHIVRNEDGVPTHFRFALPPLAVVVFEEVWEL